MAPLKLHGSPISTATLRAVACLKEKQLPFEFVPVNMATGEHKSEAFLSLNPFGQVPALEDGDFKLFDSRAITRYLSCEYEGKGTELIYHDKKKMAVVGAWMEVEAHHFDQSASKLAWEIHYKPIFGMTTDPAAVAEWQEKLCKVLDVYECRLAKSKYLGGETFTLADLHHLPCLHYLINTQVKDVFHSRPHVSAWCKDILARPAWAAVVELQSKGH